MSTFMAMNRMRGNLLRWGALGLLLLGSGLVHAQVTYVYTDPQGTPLAEADVNGNITATFDYAPYGSQALGTPPNGPGYTGHVNDPDTGLVYMQARYYDPSVGRFLSTDPVGPAAGNGFNFNRYAYAKNNPTRNTDPDGRDPASSGIIDDVKQMLASYVVKAATNMVDSMADGVKNAVQQDLKTHTYAVQYGVAGTLAAPLFDATLGPSVGVTASAGISLNSHGQVALNASTGPLVGMGGGLVGGEAIGLSRNEGGASPVGVSTSTTNHAEVDFSVPTEPVSFGISADWNQGGLGASSGLKGGPGVIMFAGGGKQGNFTYTFGNGNGN
jgi:RHS repeat-associated protein